MTTSLPNNMRAVQWSKITLGLENSLVIDHSSPLPKDAVSLPPDCTLVKVAYTTLNPIDYKIAEAVGRLVFSTPAIPCLDFAGTVVKTTRSDLRPGDLVFGKTEPPICGALAEYLVVGKEGCVPVPQGLSTREAVSLGVCGRSAYQTLCPVVKAGQHVLINGASGGTGTFGIQIAKIMGCSVTAVCSAANVALCKDLGADHVIDYTSQDLVANLKSRGQQFEVIVDYVFNSKGRLYFEAHHYLKEDGVFVTMAGGPSLDSGLSIAKATMLPQFLGGGKRAFKFAVVRTNAAEYTQLAQWMCEGKLRAVVEKEYSLEEAREAFTRLKTGRVAGKLLIRVADDDRS